ncbi:MAG: hypothetical protein NTZ47_09075 [Bacteroidetes bacterium]|nr:hypothetical protein [Bacteroidota bacterium]
MATKKYTQRELMVMAIEEMRKSVPDPNRSDGKPNPKVGAVIATPDGKLVGKSHRGELRIGDHAEFTAIERHHWGSNLTGLVVFATLEPCAPGARNHPKLSCAERITNARIGKVYIGAIDPDPSVAGEGRDFLIANKIEVDYFDGDLYDIIYNENKKFFDDAEIRAKEEHHKTLVPTVTVLTQHMNNFDLTDFSEEAQQELIDRMGLSVKVGSEGFFKFLLQLDMLYKPDHSNTVKPTGLGLLVLGRNPQSAFEQARIKFTIEQSVGDAKIKDIEGPILLMPDKAESLLDLTFLPEINRDNFHREEIVDIPKKLLRELIVNAIVHRDYTIQNKQIRIVASKDKIEIWSPGEPIIDIERFRAFQVPSISRNPKLAYVFFKSGVVEERGIGMKELKAFKNNEELPDPDFRMEEGYFVITVYRKKQKATEVKPVAPALSDEAVVAFVRQKGKISTGDYAMHFNLVPKTAGRHLNKLVKDEVLAREGEKKGTRYFIKNK